MRAADSASEIVSISDYRSNGKKQIQKWLEEEFNRKFGKKSSLLDNPLTRILIKFDALDSDSQYELYGYARRCILKDRGLSLRDKFWSVIDKGGTDDGSWEDVEEYADTLLIKARTLKSMTL